LNLIQPNCSAIPTITHVNTTLSQFALRGHMDLTVGLESDIRGLHSRWRQLC